MTTTIVLLILFGLVLVVLEIFLPGAVAGVLGGLLMVAACVLTFSQFGMAKGMLVTVGMMMASLGIFLIGMRIFPETPIGRLLILPNFAGQANVERTDSRRALSDQTGEAVTDLRPSGKAIIDGRRIDVVSEGGFIGEGQPVRVVEVDGMRVVVKKELPDGAEPV